MHTNPRPSRYRTSDWRVVPNQTSRSLAAAKNYITVLLKKKKKRRLHAFVSQDLISNVNLFKPLCVCVCALTLSCVVMILMRYIVRWQNRMTFLCGS